jgi:hypothetical protein
MTIDDIIALCRAGYTKDDLSKLVTLDNAAPAAPAALAAPEEDAGSIIAAINALGAQIKTINIAATEQPKPQTAEEVLASIILPPKPANQK